MPEPADYSAVPPRIGAFKDYGGGDDAATGYEVLLTRIRVGGVTLRGRK